MISDLAPAEQSARGEAAARFCLQRDQRAVQPPSTANDTPVVNGD
jgi:hypothetical protein